jgi:ABC-2 type transport system permease protein
MNNFRINLTNELNKQFSKKKTHALLGFTAAVPVVAALIGAFLKGSLGVMPVRGEDFPVYMLGIFAKYLLPLIIFMAAADIFAGELRNQSIKSVLLRPISRYKIYLSKLACIGVLILSLLGALFVSSCISSVIMGDDSRTIAAAIATGFLQYLAAFLPLLMLGIMASFISLLTKSSTGALVTSLIIFVISTAVSIVLPSVSKLLPTSYTGWYMLFSPLPASAAGILGIFMFIVSYCIVFLTSGYLLFERKEL